MINKSAVEAAITDLLIALCDDPTREGLRETPRRVAALYEEILAGYDTEPAEVIKFFDEDFCDDLIVVKNIEFHSVCEHHLLPFFGHVHICYKPAPGKLLGLSKLARIVEMFARRLQLQEKMAGQIADLLINEAAALGAVVIVDAEHMCISMRGIKKIGSTTTTSAVRGCFKTDKDLRDEAYKLLSRGGK